MSRFMMSSGGVYVGDVILSEGVTVNDVKWAEIPNVGDMCVVTHPGTVVEFKYKPGVDMAFVERMDQLWESKQFERCPVAKVFADKMPPMFPDVVRCCQISMMFLDGDGQGVIGNFKVAKEPVKETWGAVLICSYELEVSGEAVWQDKDGKIEEGMRE